MSSDIRVSVVIPTCNRPAVLANCLRSVVGQVSGNDPIPLECYEIIVADDSEEGSAKRALAELFPNVLFVAGPKRGPAANRNAGASCASGEILIFVDDDCICSDRLIESYLQAASANPDLKVFEGKTLAIGLPKSHADECPVNKSGGYLWSCNFGIRKTLFEIVQGFDEAFPYPAMEDVDLRYRLAARGENILFVPGATAYHPWETRLGWERVRRHRMSLLIYLKKHPSEFHRITAVSVLAWSMNHLMRETARGVLRYRLKHVSQRLRNLVGDIYVLLARSALYNSQRQRQLKFIPKAWRLQ
jgi:GT2 family glycosyltransferase